MARCKQVSSPEPTAAKELKAQKSAIKKEILKALYNDRVAIVNARDRTKAQHELAKVEAATQKIIERKLNGKHVSCRFPAFEDYIPQGVYGIGGKDKREDILVAEQLDALVGTISKKPEDESNELQEARAEKMKVEDTRQLKDIDPYVANSQVKREESAEGNEINSVEQSTARDSPASQISDEQEGSDEAEDDKDEDREVERPNMVAVSRGRPTAELNSMPSKTLQAKKQQFSTCTPSNTKAMIRGQITDVIDGERIWRWSGEEGWVAAKKRKRSRESH